MGLKRKDITPEIFENVCEEFATTEKGLEHIVEPYGIKRNTFIRYYESDKERLNRYTRARNEKVDHLASEILRLSYKMAEIIKGNTYNEININAAVKVLQIQIDALKWLLSKLAPKEYGDKIQVEADVTTSVKNVSFE